MTDAGRHLAVGSGAHNCLLRAILSVAAGVDPETTGEPHKAGEQVAVQLDRMLGGMRCDLAEPVGPITALDQLSQRLGLRFEDGQ